MVGATIFELTYQQLVEDDGIVPVSVRYHEVPWSRPLDELVAGFMPSSLTDSKMPPMPAGWKTGDPIPPLPMPLANEFRQVFESIGKAGKLRLTAAARRMMATMNKLAICQSILSETTVHTLVFFDELAPLSFYARQLQCLSIDGSTSHEDRNTAIDLFRSSGHEQVEWPLGTNNWVSPRIMAVSKIADQALDLPEAMCVLEVELITGSRGQEAQRIGRLQRKCGTVGVNKSKAQFHCLVPNYLSHNYLSQAITIQAITI